MRCLWFYRTTHCSVCAIFAMASWQRVCPFVRLFVTLMYRNIKQPTLVLSHRTQIKFTSFLDCHHLTLYACFTSPMLRNRRVSSRRRWRCEYYWIGNDSRVKTAAYGKFENWIHSEYLKTALWRLDTSSHRGRDETVQFLCVGDVN